MSITRILRPVRPPLLGYSVAVLAVAIALGIKLLLDPLFEVESPFLLFFAAIMTSALYGGRGAGVLATVLAALISNYLFLSPTYSLFNHSLGQNLRLLLFVLEGLLISGTISALTSARQRITFGQQALSESEEHYRLVVESAQDYAIFILDPDGYIATWNIGAQNLKGYRADEIIGQHFSRFYPEEDIHTSKPNQLLKVAATVGRVEDEGWRVRQDGSCFWANVIITALKDEAGNLQGFSKVTRDITKNKQAEEALRQSEEKFRLVAETLPQIVWTAQPDGSVDYYNQRWAEYSGILQEEGQGWGWKPVVHPDDEQRTIEAWTQAVQTGQLYECDHRVRRADGEFRWHLSRGLPLRDSEGRIIKWFGTATEIHEHKQIEEALRQSEERFRQAIVNAPFPMVIHAEDGEIFQINQTWMELTGYTQEEIPTIADWTEKAYGERQEIVLEVIDHLYELQDKVSEGEFTITTKQKTRRIWDFSSAPLGRLPDGRRMVLSMAADVTERKWAEEQLRTRTRQQEAIASLGQRALSGIDLSTLMDEATSLIAQTLDVEYCKVLELLPSGDAVLLRAGVGWQDRLVGRATVSTGSDSQAGYTLLSSEPVIVTDLRSETRFSGPPLLHQHNVVSGLSTIISGQERAWGVLGAHTTRYQTFTQDDIHFLQAAANILAEAIQRQQAEATLQQQSEELAQANRLKDEFLATLSHELRTPLNSMLGWTKLLPTRRLNEATMGRAMETISRNTQALAQLIEDVLDMSDVIRGQLNLNVSPVEVVPILDQAIASIRSAAEAKTIKIVTQLDPTVGFILGDANRLQQVFWNLLSNAVKFTPKQGHIEVRLKRINDQVQIQVSDTGLGISADFLPFVFDRFRQENGSITRSHGGLGMGLAIVRYLVELQGGTVRAESPGTGQGATFTLSFPITTVPKSDTELALIPPVMSDTASANHSVEGLRVLIVDDDADTRELLTVILAENGVQASAVATVREALDALQNLKPHVLVSDIGMPEEDGYDLIRQLRALVPEQGGRIPAVALTAYAREDDRIQALSAGFQMHIPKPIEPLQLLAVVASLASRVSDKLPIN